MDLQTTRYWIKLTLQELQSHNKIELSEDEIDISKLKDKIIECSAVVSRLSENTTNCSEYIIAWTQEHHSAKKCINSEHLSIVTSKEYNDCVRGEKTNFLNIKLQPFVEREEECKTALVELKQVSFTIDSKNKAVNQIISMMRMCEKLLTGGSTSVKTKMSGEAAPMIDMSEV